MANSATPWAPDYRFLTADEAPIEFGFRERHEDFVVEELPSFEPSGEGEHLLLKIEKRGMPTTDLVQRLALHLDLPAKEIGWAGRKDARAVTRQWISIPAKLEGRLKGIESEDLKLLDRARNDRKLRLGALVGNRFELRLRGVSKADRERAQRSLEVIFQRGLPNYFGAQRFGRQGYAFELGKALLSGDAREYLLRWVSPKHAPDTKAMGQFRERLASERPGDHRRCKELVGEVPREYGPFAKQIARRAKDWQSALRAVSRSDQNFHVSAYQSYLFNRVLSARFESFDEPQLGDLLQKHPSHSFFQVDAEDDLDELRARAARGELSPTGPLPGGSTPMADGEPGRLEREILSEEGQVPEAFGAAAGDLRISGARRSLRAIIREPWQRFEDRDLLLGFELPAGSYATTLVAELSKHP